MALAGLSGGCAVDEGPSDGLYAAYASATAPSIGVVSLVDCDAPGFAGELSVTVGDETRSLGAWDPVCGRKVGVLLGLDFGAATSATFTLTVSGPMEMEFSAVLPAR